MILGIDASNVRAGGGLTHLSSLLGAADPAAHGFERVRVFIARAGAATLPTRTWLEPVTPAALDGSLPVRLHWLLRELPGEARDCAVLFAPGGLVPYRFSPVVTMSQNMLPFEWRELRRYGVSRMGLRLLLLALAQRWSFRRADGMIFLTGYAEKVVRRAVRLRGPSARILHGVDDRFDLPPRPARSLEEADEAHPLRIVYVSIVDVYKHPWNVARAVAALRQRGWPVAAELVGPAYPPALARLERTLDELDPGRRFLRYRGPLPYAELPDLYREADVCAFASSCENGPNVLLEAMRAGMPIASSDRGPMPELLGDAGLYFDPEDPASIARALERLVQDPPLRLRLSRAARERVEGVVWARCAEQTLAFLAGVAQARTFSSFTGGKPKLPVEAPPARDSAARASASQHRESPQ